VVDKMLIPEKLNTIIRIVLYNAFNDKYLSLSELAKEARMSPAMTKRLVMRLVNSGYATSRGRIKIIDPVKLMKAWGYLYSVRELEKREFVSAERPQYVTLKIANWARTDNIQYAFTLFSATEQVSPYVAPSTTYVYILEKDITTWEKFFRKEKILPAEKEGNVTCLMVDEDYFKGVWNVRGNVSIVSLPQLYADLMSFGGRGTEAARELRRVIDRRSKNV
jgi:hypothetical protein